jgi:Tol biopolymer transport system component
MSRLTLLIAATTFTLIAMPTPTPAQSELIPRKHIFGNPMRNSATLSPDGRQLAFLAPRDGVVNVFVAPVNAIDQAKPVTSDTVRPIRTFFWSPDSTRILFVQDKGGNENWMLYGVELATGKQTTYTDFDKAQVRIVSVSPKVPARS